jgi:pimeloyl-ACP methyl ester carboxylesterase
MRDAFTRVFKVIKKIILTFVALAGAVYVALALYAYWPTPETYPARELAAPEDQFVQLKGLDIRYRTFGERGSAYPEIVLLHGFANNLNSFYELAGMLAECCFVVALDFPGFGLSAKPTGYDYGNRNQSAIVVQLSRSLDLEAPVYIGHSMGGAIALHASLQDEYTRALVLIDPAILTVGQSSSMQPQFFPFPRLGARIFGARSTRLRFLKTSYVNSSVISERDIDQLMLASRTDDYWSGMTDMMANTKPISEEQYLPGVGVPVLSIWGEFDQVYPPDEPYRLQTALPGSQLHIVKGAGHYAHEEAPAEVHQVIMDWLNQYRQ